MYVCTLYAVKRSNVEWERERERGKSLAYFLSSLHKDTTDYNMLYIYCMVYYM